MKMFSRSGSDRNSTGDTAANEELVQQMNLMAERMDKLDHTIEALVKRIEALEKPENIAVQAPVVPVLRQVEAPRQEATPVSESCYYLAAPTPDGLFADVSQREQIGKSIYQLTTRDGLSGNFILLDTPDAIATAMISVSQFVKPACKVTGSTSRLPSHIVTEEEGVAVKEADSWRITRKAVVRFE